MSDLSKPERKGLITEFIEVSCQRSEIPIFSLLIHLKQANLLLSLDL